jgi:hypothetical protein
MKILKDMDIPLKAIQAMEDVIPYMKDTGHGRCHLLYLNDMAGLKKLIHI